MAYVGKKPQPFYLGQVDDLNVQGDAAVTGNLTVTGTTITLDSASVQTVDLGDNDKIRLGDADDAQIYHDGTNTIINNDTGNIAITGSNVGIGTSSPADQLDISGTVPKMRLTDTDGSAYHTIRGSGNGSLELAADEGNTGSNASSMAFRVDGSERMRIDSSGRVGIGTSSPTGALDVQDNTGSLGATKDITAEFNRTDGTNNPRLQIRHSTSGSDINHTYSTGASALTFSIVGSERMRIDSSIKIGKTVSGLANTGVEAFPSGVLYVTRDSNTPAFINRLTNDGALLSFRQNGTEEGYINVSGSAVSLVGGHLARWSRLSDDSKDTSIVKGTVMTNLDEMVVWSHDAVEAQDAVYDEEGNVISEAVEAKEAYTEDNEQLNKMAVSSVEGDPNVAGVFVNWDDQDNFNDMNVAMTGDMVIRIAQGTTVQRGDLLMSAGDGTAKPQGDDIVRSKTIAKVTSTHVSHTYDDGSYLVPCVLMAC